MNKQVLHSRLLERGAQGARDDIWDMAGSNLITALYQRTNGFLGLWLVAGGLGEVAAGSGCSQTGCQIENVGHGYAAPCVGTNAQLSSIRYRNNSVDACTFAVTSGSLPLPSEVDSDHGHVRRSVIESSLFLLGLGLVFAGVVGSKVSEVLFRDTRNDPLFIAVGAIGGTILALSVAATAMPPPL